jgi:hypothetical protein
LIAETAIGIGVYCPTQRAGSCRTRVWFDQGSVCWSSDL